MNLKKQHTALLRFERTTLRDNVTKILNDQLSPTQKQAAVSAIAAGLSMFAVQGDALAKELSLTEQEKIATLGEFSRGLSLCDKLCETLCKNGNPLVDVKALVKSVDEAHENSKQVCDARNIEILPESQATGNGGKPPVTAWLMSTIS